MLTGFGPYANIVVWATLAIAVIILGAIVWWAVRRARANREERAPIPLIPVGGGYSASPIPARPDRGRPTPPSRADDLRVQPPVDPRLTRPAAATSADASSPAYAASRIDGRRTEPYTRSVEGGSPATPAAPTPSLAAHAPPVAEVSGAPSDTWGEVGGEAVEGQSVRFWRPADGTLQFLPGRLEVVAGRDAGQEIRFVRTPGPEGTRVTFGRAEGPPYRHVQLREPTVSRAHARMALEAPAPGAGGAGGAGGAAGAAPRWRLENLSATNPVVVNGRPLAPAGAPGAAVLLADGDRVEMGEVAFLFHER